MSIHMPPSGGVVYLLKYGAYYKIGMTRNLSRRLDQLATQMPERPELIHAIHTDEPEMVEQGFHGLFAGKRKNGEWFALTQEDVEEFCRYNKKMYFDADEEHRECPLDRAAQALREARGLLGPEPTNLEDLLGI
jgi:Meiotically up-regulated gene 113